MAKIVTSRCQGPHCGKPAKRDYCSDRCRARAWREKNLPRCPHCKKVITVTISSEEEEN